MKPVLRPSKKDYLYYDAQRYEEDGFIEVSGRVRALASSKPRYWQITATARTKNADGTERRKHHFKFRTESRYTLSELAPIVNDQIHSDEDYLPDCESVMVVARVML